MLVGNRLRELREEKKLSQGDIEQRTGLLRCYVSRVENGHTVPSLETLERFAWALEVPLYRLFYEGDDPPQPVRLKRLAHAEEANTPQVRFLRKLGRAYGRLTDPDRGLLLGLAKQLSDRARHSVALSNEAESLPLI